MQDTELNRNETLANRLADILVRLNSGYKLDPAVLAKEYDTHPRTIKRDFDRFEACRIPLQKEGKFYFLDPKYLGKLSFKDIKVFSQISGIQHLYPQLDVSFVRELLDSRVYDAKGYSFEEASLFKELFHFFSKAILNNQRVTFIYKEKIRTVEPYKLLHHHGSWYLAASCSSELKAYRLSRIMLAEKNQKSEKFKHDQKILKQLEDENSIWFGQEKYEVILNIHADVALHFKQRSLLPEQNIIELLDDGGLVISSRIIHHTQLLPLVRYWIPHIKIVSPKSLQSDLERGLRDYLTNY